MPRQRIHHGRRTHDFPDDFAKRLVLIDDNDNKGAC